MWGLHVQAAEFLFSAQNKTVFVCSVISVCMRTRMKIYSCLLAFVLGCNVTAEIQQKIIREKASISLRCPHSVEGKVTWSREINGNKVDILTVEADGDIRHNDPRRRYSSLADKTLHIRRAAVSDTGRYFCNNEPAVELTVIPSGHKVPPTMTTTPKTTTTTPPPPPTTRRTTPPPLPAPSTPPSPPTTRRTPPPPPTTRRTTPPPLPAPSTPLVNTAAPEDQQLQHGLVFGITTGLLLVLILILIIIVLSFRRHRSNRRGNEETYIYDEILNGLVSPTTNGVGSSAGPTAAQPMTTFARTSQLKDSTYVLLGKPKAPGNNSEQYLHSFT
ncbi:myosin tail region-interacting protein MTI1-like isoform X3 [Siniperca chuatsi]|uniref:myosin tail region-interacting protein MTI1-like isoform X3 n=1 Tax=Siniperca chuatsi TaxID=119488 RepID=UPI001CE22AD5|nr:myosin tail region-interacting protein MTI1-like isoform X3 [Siniperca chuatsi]